MTFALKKKRAHDWARAQGSKGTSLLSLVVSVALPANSLVFFGGNIQDSALAAEVYDVWPPRNIRSPLWSKIQLSLITDCNITIKK